MYMQTLEVPLGFKESIVFAFNLGVSKRYEKREATVEEVAGELRKILEAGIGSKEDVDPATRERAIEYYLEIALLGFILPWVASPREDLKEVLLGALTEKVEETYEGYQERGKETYS